MTYFAKMHLTKNSNGKIACGRNAHNSHMSAKWEQFKNAPHQCEACAASKAAVFYAKAEADQWEPEDRDAWMKADDVLVANKK